jgi:hypothetical protein
LADGFLSAFAACADAAVLDTPESPSSAWAMPIPLANATPIPNVIAPAPSQRYGMAFRGTRRLLDIESPNPDQRIAGDAPLLSNPWRNLSANQQD